MTIYYSAHLARLNRMGLRPAGHLPACTCDLCWKAADDAYAEMTRRAAQRRTKSRQRRRINKKLRAITGQPLYGVRLLDRQGGLVHHEAFHAKDQTQAVVFALALWDAVSSMAARFELVDALNSVILVYERPQPPAAWQITERMQERRRVMEETLFSNRAAIAKSRATIERLDAHPELGNPTPVRKTSSM